MLVKIFKFLMLLLALLLILVTLFLVLAIESEPIANGQSHHQVDQAESVKLLLKQVSGSVKDRANKQIITINEKQLNSLVGVAQRANAHFSGEVTILPSQASIVASYYLPNNPVGRYLNVSVLVLPGKGVIVDYVKIGPFYIPGNWTVAALVYYANWSTKSDIASQFLQQVESVSMVAQQIDLSMLPLAPFLKALNLAKQGVSGSGDQGLRLKTSYYLKQLSLLPITKSSSSVSLALYMGPLFSWAQARSTADTAALENEAAIMALAIYAGHHRFANLVGDVQPKKGYVALPTVKPMLGLRGDLNQHFIFSAAIKILSEQGLSIAIGEFKELMDRSKDGSGFSFVDLAADFAGVKFAEVATNDHTALQVQQILADNTLEASFFPGIQGLPEGLNKAAFTRRFKQVDSPEYKQLVAEIRLRIQGLAIHQVHATQAAADPQ